jgi:hypothetical protein
MRIIEILCIPLYFPSIFKSLELLTVIFVRESDAISQAHLMQEDVYNLKLINKEINEKLIPMGYRFLHGRCSKAEFQQFGGRMREFLVIEVLVFAFLIGSMLVLMIKSRFKSVGVDNSH